ncbi:hypothetical protein [Bacillus suaedae]|uniref:Uncharacterized protein n=1 Tax=Halalkalibacter suaedae TaxID=2822140 RepID=A0A940WY68_9BACI|nr:hypothetical protein [Bacillus suaedae]MBP3950139.1 hypothetical protein [Bacillus suaedae]
MSSLSRQSLLALIILERFTTGEQDRVSIRNNIPTFDGFFKFNEDLNKQIRNQLRYLWNENLIMPTTNTKKLQKFQITKNGQQFLKRSVPIWKELISKNQQALLVMEEACQGEFTTLIGFHTIEETKFLNKILDQRTVSLSLIFIELKKKNTQLSTINIQKLLLLRYGLSISETALTKYLVELTQIDAVIVSPDEVGRKYAVFENQILAKEKLKSTMIEIEHAKQCLDSMHHFITSLTPKIKKYG